MSYELSPTAQNESKLFFRLEGETAERHGAVCSMQLDFDVEHDGAFTFRFDCQRHLRTPAFKADSNCVIAYLRGETEPFGNLQNYTAFCREHEGQMIKSDEINVPHNFGVKTQTEEYSYYFRCHHHINRVNIFTYDNRWLLPELAGKHELPEYCYSTMPASGNIIVVRSGERGFYGCQHNEHDIPLNREYARKKNEELGVTPAQAEAMRAGALFGWDIPAAKPWHYYQNGDLLPQAPKKNEPER